MNPVLSTVVGSLVRMALGGLVGWLIRQGVMQPNQTEAFYAAIATAVIGIGWAVWNNIVRRRLLNTAAALPPGPVSVVVKAVSSGVFAPATTPQNVTPKLQGSDQ